MADTIGHGFKGPQPVSGPYRCGSLAILDDQEVTRGQLAGDVSAVGCGEFGRMISNRLQCRSVGVSGVWHWSSRPLPSRAAIAGDSAAVAC